MTDKEKIMYCNFSMKNSAFFLFLFMCSCTCAYTQNPINHNTNEINHNYLLLPKDSIVKINNTTWSLINLKPAYDSKTKQVLHIQRLSSQNHALQQLIHLISLLYQNHSLISHSLAHYDRVD